MSTKALFALMFAAVFAVDPYVAPVRVAANGSVQPGNLRESIRSAGPTIELPATG